MGTILDTAQFAITPAHSTLKGDTSLSHPTHRNRCLYMANHGDTGRIAIFLLRHRTMFISRLLTSCTCQSYLLLRNTVTSHEGS